MEEVFEKQKNGLEIQIEEDKQTIKQLEVRLDMARRTIQEARSTQAAAEKELHQVSELCLIILYFRILCIM